MALILSMTALVTGSQYRTGEIKVSSGFCRWTNPTNPTNLATYLTRNLPNAYTCLMRKSKHLLNA
jgi:hypothetical protein